MSPASPCASTVTVNPEDFSKSASTASSTTKESWVTSTTSLPAVASPAVLVDGVPSAPAELPHAANANAATASPADHLRPAPRREPTPFTANGFTHRFTGGFKTVPLPLTRVRHGWRWRGRSLRRHDPDQVRRSGTPCPSLSPAHRTPVSPDSLRRRRPVTKRPRSLIRKLRLARLVNGPSWRAAQNGGSSGSTRRPSVGVSVTSHLAAPESLDLP